MEPRFKFKGYLRNRPGSVWSTGTGGTSEDLSAFDGWAFGFPPLEEELRTKEHLQIDDMVAEQLNFSGHQERIRDTLIEQVRFRMARSRS